MGTKNEKMYNRIINLIAEEIMEFNPPTFEIKDKVEYSSELKGYVSLENPDIVYTSEEFNRSFYWHDKNGKPIKIDNKLQYHDLKFNPIENLGHTMLLLNKIRFDYKYQVEIYSDDNGFEISIGDPKILNGKCYEFGDEIIALNKSDKFGEGLCLACLDMKNLKINE